MATGAEEISHNGFDQRIEVIRANVANYSGGAENIAYNYAHDPAQQGFDWWLTSEGHRQSLENDFYDLTGIGVAKNEDGRYFITQMFANIDPT